MEWTTEWNGQQLNARAATPGAFTAVFRRQGFGQGTSRGKPRHSGWASSSGLSSGIYGNGAGWNGVEKFVHIIQLAARKGGYRQGEMLIGGLMSSEKNRAAAAYGGRPT